METKIKYYEAGISTTPNTCMIGSTKKFHNFVDAFNFIAKEFRKKYGAEFKKRYGFEYDSLICTRNYTRNLKVFGHKLVEVWEYGAPVKPGWSFGTAEIDLIEDTIY